METVIPGIKKGTASKILTVFIGDSSVTTGAGLTGLLYNSAGLTAYYIRSGDAAPTQITLVTATVGTYASGGFKEIDSVNMKGLYELHLPDACLAAGADLCSIILQGAASMRPVSLKIPLRDNTEKDIYDRLGAPAGVSMSADVAAVKTDTGNIYTRLGAPAGASVSADIAAIKTDTGNTLAESTSHPTLAEIEASAVLAKEATGTAIKAKTDKLIFDANNFVKSTHTFKTGAVVGDPANGQGQFKTDLTEAADDSWTGGWLGFTTGANANLPPKKIGSYKGATKFVYLSSVFPNAVAPGDQFKIIFE